MDSLSSLLKQAAFQSDHKDVIIDLTLLNGVSASNRYILLRYDNHNYNLDLSKSQTIKESILDNITQKDGYNEEFVQFLKFKTCEYLRKNLKLLDYSTLQNAHKYILTNSEDII